MKEKISRIFHGNMVAGFLAMVLIMIGVLFVENGSSKVFASDTTKDFFAVEAQLENYRSENGYTYPKPTEDGKEDYIFAGWYTDESCTTAYTASTIEGAASAWAKYVPETIMDVKFQVSSGTNIASEKTNLRMVSTVDTTNYQQVGYVITANNKELVTDATSVYKRIKSNTEGLDYGFSPVVFDTDSEYFLTFTIKNIKNKNFNRTYNVKPYWVTLDGTTVYGCGRNVKVSDSYNDIANVPVRIYADNVTAGSTITVTYDSTDFTYQDFELGGLNPVDAGVTVTDNKNGSITCTVSKNIADANGMLVNLRFKINSTASSNETFTMAGTGAFNYLYRVFDMSYDGTPDMSWYEEFNTDKEFVVSTPADLYGLAKLVNDGTDNFWDNTIYMAADIAINQGNAYLNEDGTAGFTTTQGASLYDWIAIGHTARFKGTFDGKGNTISGIYLIDDEKPEGNALTLSNPKKGQYHGLFGITDPASNITNFTIENSVFISDSECGNRVDQAGADGSAKDKVFDATSNDYTQALLGSVAGQIMGNVSGIHSTAIVVSREGKVAGGLFGRLNADGNERTINNCWFDGKVYASSDNFETKEIGGLVGTIISTGTYNINNCLNTGEVTCIFNATGTKGAGVGGLIGHAASAKYKLNVNKCLNTGVLDVQRLVTTDGVSALTPFTTGGGVAGFFYTANTNSTTVDGKKVYNVSITNSITTLSSYGTAFQASSGFPINSSNCASVEQADSYYSGVDAWTTAERLGIYTNDDENNATKYWVVKEDGLVGLKSFTKDWIDFGWYYNHKTDDPDTFVIETAEEFYGFSHVSQSDSFTGDTVTLGENIELNSGVASIWAKDTNTAPTREWIPIASNDRNVSFNGTFDGNNKTIRGIYINKPASNSNYGVGLFAYVKGNIRNVRLENSYIDSTARFTGSIVGFLCGNINNVYSDTFIKCTGTETGGLVGRFGGNYGLSSSETGQSITNSWYNGELENSNTYTGGIVGNCPMGKTTKTISNCLNTGVITSTNSSDAYVGGIVGGIGTTSLHSFEINNCVNASELKTKEGANYVGSVIGNADRPLTIENVYTTAATGETIEGVGVTDVSSTIQGKPAIVTETELKGKSAYIYTDLDFTSENSVWGAVEGGTPVLKALYDGTVMTKLSGQRVSTDWYYNNVYYNQSLTDSTQKFTVQNVADFYGLSKVVNAGHTFTGQTVELVKNGDFNLNPNYKVTVDKENGTVSTSGSVNQWTPIGPNDVTCFDGTFDGNMNTIKGIYVKASSGRPGLFGSTGENSLVENFTIENSYYESSSTWVAAVATVSSGDFNNIYLADNVGIVSTYDGGNNGRAAGIVAYWQGTNEATISNCWFDGYVSAYRRYVSGIAGQIYNGTKTIENCLFTGSVEGMGKNALFHGGLAGAIMGSTTESPTVYLKNSVVKGSVKAMSANAVGSVVGRAITNGQNKNNDKVYLYVENVYTTDNLILDDSVTPLANNNYRMNGCGDLTTQYNHTFGEPMIVTASELAGLEGYINTDLDFASEWVATNECPKLASFATADVTDFEDVQRVSISWFYNAAEYSLSSLDTENKYANQLNSEYELSDDADMYGFAAIVNGNKKVYGKTELFADKTVKLTNDIIFNNVSPTGNEEAAGWADGTIPTPTTSWVPIGTVKNTNTIVNAFQGTFDGDGHVIRGLYVTGDTANQYLGLFRKLKDATVCDLRIENSYFNTSKAAFIGSVAGGGDGTFDSVYSNAIIRGSRFAGGLIGRVSENQDNNDDTEMFLKNCHFDGVVDLDYTGKDALYSGGLVGYVVHGSTLIDTCLYTGRISLDYNCNQTSKTSWGAYVGALCGGDNGKTTGYVQVKNCISAGSVNSKVLSGSTSPEVAVIYTNQTIGYARHANSWAKNTYVFMNNTRTIESTGETTESDETFARGDNSLVSNFDVDSSFEKETLFGYGAQMWTDLAFTNDYRLAADNAALDKGAEAITKAGPIWAAIAGELPVPATLADNALEMTVGKPDTDLAGDGLSLETAYQITTVEELAGFALNSKSDNYAGKYVVLANDIIINEGEDASEWVDDKAEPTLPWNIEIGSSKGTDGQFFEGIFDGQGYTISGICFENGSPDRGVKEDREFVGLFATTEVGSEVKNLRLTNSYFEQVGIGWVGSVIGKCRGTVSNVYSDAVVKSPAENVGGIIAMADGYNYKNASAGTESRISRTVDNCWYEGEIILVDEGRYSGGIIGLVNQGEWTLNNCVFTGKITCNYKGDSYAYVGGMSGALNAPTNIKTSTTETKLTLNSCISAGNIKTVNGDYGAGAFVGRLKADVEFNSTKEGETTTTTLKDTNPTHLVMNNVFATRDSGYQEVGHYGTVKESDSAGNQYTATPTISGAAVWTNNADRLVGYCTEEKASDYAGGSLDFDTFVIREEGVPVPNNFTDLEIVTPIQDVDTILALKTMDASWTTKGAVNNGLGHYVLRTEGKDLNAYTTYLAALVQQGFGPYITMDETGTDGVYNMIYTKAEGKWVLNVLFVEKTGKVTLTISNGFDSLSPDLEPKESTSGTVTLSMLKLTGSKEENLGLETYYYGNSFVFKLPNGHFVINDGGKEADMPGLMAYLRKEAGFEANDTKSKIYIDAWTVTHQHGDHFSVMRNIVDNPEYAEQLVVNAIYLNEPNRNAMLCEDGSDVMDTVAIQYRGIRMLKDEDGNMSKVYWCQTGQTYYFDGLTMNILQSQEQIPVNSYGKRKSSESDGTDYNTSSTNMLFKTSNGKKVLITGDSNYKNMEWIMNAYGSSSQMLENINVYQVVHHGKNTSYNISSTDHTFTDYIAGKNKNGKIDVSLFPCSVFYEYSGDHESKYYPVFPAAGAANKYLIEQKSSQSFNYGEGTIKVILSDEITAGLDTTQ